MNRLWHEVEAIQWLDETRESLEQLRHWLQKKQMASPPASKLVTADADALTQSDIRELSRAFFLEMDHERATRLLQALGHLVEVGNKAGCFQLNLPARPVRIHPEPSLHRATKLGDLAVVDRWGQALRATSDTSPDAGRQVAIGGLLVSAALFGGLLSSAHLGSLFVRLHRPLSVISGRSYLDLSLRWRGQDDSETRRWFPDRLSQCLYARLSDQVLQEHCDALDSKPVSAKKLWQPMKAWFKHANVATQDCPANLTEFLKLANQLNAQQVPMAHAAHQARTSVSHSLRSEVWQRLNKAVEPVSLDISESESTAIDTEEPYKTRPSIELETGPWAASFWRAVGQANTRKDLRQSALPIPFGSDPVEQILNEWCDFMACHSSLAGKTLQPSTIQRYLRSVGKRFPGLVDSRNVKCLGSSELESLYQAILDDAPSLAERHRMAAGLREFHHFLCARHHAEPLANASKTLGSSSILAPVDANLVSFDEYEAARQHLRSQDLELVHPALPDIADLMLILGFRCGARRMEALRLRLQDHHSLGVAATRITPHAERTLKTLSSRRTIPTQALLSADELALLHDWQARRRAQERAHPFSQAMFALPDRQWAYVPEETVIQPIHRALRAVTGDPRLRFHHLRHSFASWSYLRLALSRHKGPIDLFEHQPLTQQILNEGATFREALNLGDRWRSYLHAVASLLGHSGPDISELHYIHTMDLAELVMRNERKNMSVTDCVQASGQARSTVFRVMGDQGDRGLVRLLSRQYPHRFQWLQEAGPMAGGRHERDDSDDPCPLASAISRVDRYWRLRGRGVDQDLLAERFGWSLEQCHEVEQARSEVEAIRSHDHRSVRRHRMTPMGTSETGGETNLPNAPYTRLGKEVVEQLSPKMFQLLHEWPVEQTRSVLDYFMHNQWKYLAHLIFHNPNAPEMARLYLEFLSKLGFKRSDIRLINHDVRQKSEYRALWRSQLNVAGRYSILCKPPQNKERPASRRWLFISPVWKLQEGVKHDDSLSGFRYLMVMTAVVSRLPWLLGK